MTLNRLPGSDRCETVQSPAPRPGGYRPMPQALPGNPPQLRAQKPPRRHSQRRPLQRLSIADRQRPGWGLSPAKPWLHDHAIPLRRENANKADSFLVLAEGVQQWMPPPGGSHLRKNSMPDNELWPRLRRPCTLPVRHVFQPTRRPNGRKPLREDLTLYGSPSTALR